MSDAEALDTTRDTFVAGGALLYEYQQRYDGRRVTAKTFVRIAERMCNWRAPQY